MRQLIYDINTLKYVLYEIIINLATFLLSLKKEISIKLIYLHPPQFAVDSPLNSSYIIFLIINE